MCWEESRTNTGKEIESDKKKPKPGNMTTVISSISSRMHCIPCWRGGFAIVVVRVVPQLYSSLWLVVAGYDREQQYNAGNLATRTGE